MSTPRLALTAPVGPAGAPLIVLGPSLGTSSALWGRVTPLLTDTYRVVAWDLPGHGASPAADAPFSIADLADAVASAVAERVTGQVDSPFFYAGVSLGGCVGLELLLRHAPTLRAAAIVASGARIGDTAAWQARAAQVRRQGTSSLITTSAGRWFAPGTIARDPDTTGRLLHALRDTDDESYALACEALAGFDLRPRLRDVTLPVLAVWGAHDQVTPEAFAREIALGVRDGRTTGIQNAAHLPPIDDPTATAAALRSLFDGLAHGLGTTGTASPEEHTPEEHTPRESEGRRG